MVHKLNIKFSGEAAPHQCFFEAQVSLLCPVLCNIGRIANGSLMTLLYTLISYKAVCKQKIQANTSFISICAPLAIAVNDIVLS